MKSRNGEAICISHLMNKVFRIAMLAFLAVVMMCVIGENVGKAESTYGSTEEDVILTVRSLGGDAYIDLYSEWGLARIENRTVLDIYISDTVEYNHGFYYLNIYYNGGSEAKIGRWTPSATTNKDHAYTGERIRITLPKEGEYKIYIGPLDTETINTYWKHDRFLSWERKAEWYVCDSHNCFYGNNLYDHGTVTVWCYGDGEFLESYQVDVSENQMIYPKELNGYTINAFGTWVEFSGATGQCTPSAVSFYYNRIVTEPEITQGDSSCNPEQIEQENNASDANEYVSGNTSSNNSLPTLPWYDCAAYLNDPYVDYIRPQCGPGDNYQVFQSRNGKKQLYDPDEMTRADICFTVGDWEYVGFGYSDGKWRFGFFRKSVFTPYDGWDAVPEYSLDYERSGIIRYETVPYNGPDWNSGDYTSCTLYSGDTVYACMEYNGWYLCRFYNGYDKCYGYVYLWVPGSSIQWN